MKVYEVYALHHENKCREKTFISKDEALKYLQELELDFSKVYIHEFRD